MSPPAEVLYNEDSAAAPPEVILPQKPGSNRYKSPVYNVKSGQTVRYIHSPTELS